MWRPPVRLAAIAVVLAAGCGTASQPSTPTPTPSPAAALAPVDDVPAAVRRRVRQQARTLAPGGLAVAVYRGRRRDIAERLSPGAPVVGDNVEVYLATFTGDVVYRRARTPPGERDTVTGRFAFATYDTAGVPLDFAVLPTVPETIR